MRPIDARWLGWLLLCSASLWGYVVLWCAL